MSRFFSLPLFSLTFSIGYAWAVYVNWPLFRYYPLVNRFSLSDLADKTLGPAMSWYGWMAVGALPAILVAVIGGLAIPQRAQEKLWPLFWLCPVIMLIAGFVREQDWLLK